MADFLSIPKLETRPSLIRSRSSSSPIATRDENKTQNDARPTRPVHVRSHSHMSPIELKPTISATFPPARPDKATESSLLHRLHLPGRHHHQQSAGNEDVKPVRSHHGRHKHAQSDTQQYNKKKESPLLNNDSPGTPAITTTPASSSSEHHYELLYPSSRGTVPSLMRMGSHRSHRAHFSADITSIEKPYLRRRATSDPRNPAHDNSSSNNNNQLQPTTTTSQLRPAQKTPIEIALDRADLHRRLALESATEADLKHKRTQIRAGRNELHNRLLTTTRSATNLVRRLDDAQDTLFRTTESLLDTISSFSTLAEQSGRLIENFEHEARHLDGESRARIKRFREYLVLTRGKRVEELETRSRNMSVKAEELGRRLENCRVIVANWEEREMNKRRAWRGVWVGIAWGVALIVGAVLVGVVSWKVVEIRRGGHGSVGVGGSVEKVLLDRTVLNSSYDVRVLEELRVPEDVREILIDIDARARSERVEDGTGSISVGAGQEVKEDGGTGMGREDKGLRMLDEL